MQIEKKSPPVAKIFNHPINNPSPRGLVGNLANPLLIVRKSPVRFLLKQEFESGCVKSRVVKIHPLIDEFKTSEVESQ